MKKVSSVHINNGQDTITYYHRDTISSDTPPLYVKMVISIIFTDKMYNYSKLYQPFKAQKGVIIYSFSLKKQKS